MTFFKKESLSRISHSRFSELLPLIEKGLIKSPADIYYLTHRCTHSDEKARSILNSLLSIVSMLDSTAVDVFHALSSETTDFEDAVMIETAIRSKVDCIITRNTKDYRKSPVPVYTPDDFMKALEDEFV